MIDKKSSKAAAASKISHGGGGRKVASNIETCVEFENALVELTKTAWGSFFLTSESLIAAQRKTGLAMEQFLIQEANVARTELTQRIIEMKGTYGFFFFNIFLETGLALHISKEEASLHHVLPLATYGDRLYCLIGRGDDAGHSVRLIKTSSGDEYHVIALGIVADIDKLLGKVYKALEKHDGTSLRLGEFLVKLGQISQGQLDDCLREQAETGKILGEILLRHNLVSEGGFYEALAGLIGMPYYSSAELLKLADQAYARQLPLSYVKSNQIIALHGDSNRVWLATADPLNQEKIDSTASALRSKKIHVGVAAPSAIFTAMNSLYYDPFKGQELFLPVDDVKDQGVRAPIAAIKAETPQYLRYILYEGVRKKASDIHIEHYEDRVDVKFRIDGNLLKMPEITFLNTKNVQSFVAKVKVDANLDIAEQRRPQDGVIRKNISGNAVDFRVAIVPTLWGENIVLRILNQSKEIPKLFDLGLPEMKLRSFHTILSNPQGFILLTGPTGCGKTTTLYAILQDLRKTGRKIVTAEDPIEYAMDGIQQSQVNQVLGNTFDRYMRSFMRLDPDIILVGEIRDQVTAQMATKAAMTGHLVLSTLHVNDSVSTVRRLADLQVEWNLISQTLVAVISQRLARKICPKCIHPYEPDPLIMEEYFPEGLPFEYDFSHGAGCPNCLHTGYSGRLALVEFWQPGGRARSLIDKGADSNVLREAAVENGLKLIAEDALEKIQYGLTTLEEVVNVVPQSQIKDYLRLVGNMVSPP